MPNDNLTALMAKQQQLAHDLAQVTFAIDELKNPGKDHSQDKQALTWAHKNLHHPKARQVLSVLRNKHSPRRQ